ncbi:MAG: hypothetical protein O4804_16970 [Trichodesmium sp. St11_bin5]|nr:hypothetical protein [Trichodesmium sp. St11_bin5]
MILGEPGAGKTITLLDLARDLVEFAEDDSNYRIPVVLELTSWREKLYLQNFKPFPKIAQLLKLCFTHNSHKL